MKSYKLFKAIPLLCTFVFVLLIGLNNKKQSTNLTLLIWDTPKSSLGTYIAISTVSGFLLSYLFINSLASNAKPGLKRVIKYEFDAKNDEYPQSKDFQKEISYEQTLIERNYRDPSPTMKAEFRVIGNVEKINRNYSKDESDIQGESVPATQNEYQEEYETNKFDDYNICDEQNNNYNDWENISFESW